MINQQESEFDFLFTRSIEFRQETIYFVIVDRFEDGFGQDSARRKNPELYDATKQKWGRYWGGDLQGVINRLDYLKGMGVTAIWVSPLFEQVDKLQFESAAMHGYWTKDFKRINPRFLAPDESNSLHSSSSFDRLIEEMHSRGMKLILDIVCNHSSPDVGGEKGRLFDDGTLIADFKNDTNNWYYHNPEITDWEDEWQLLYGEMAGLATFNESNIDYRDYIKSAIKQWLDQGVDALRVDTLKHMPIWFWQEFCADIRTHKPSVFIFGEYGFSKPTDARSVIYANTSSMSILDFGFCGAVRAALGTGDKGGFYLIQDVLKLDYLYDRATELITFIDNHDMTRFQSLNSDPQILRLAMILLMTSRGIPCIYYGTEQYLHNDTNGGNDPYNRPMMENWDTNSELYKDLKLLSKFRRLNPAVSLGSQVEKYITEDVYCYTRGYRDSRCFVAMNKGAKTTINIESTGLEDGDYICSLTRRFFEIVDGKLFDLILESKEVVVLNYIGEKVSAQVVVRAQLNGFSTKPGQQIAIVGDCPELGNWDSNKAYILEYVNQNTWFGEIPFDQSIGKPITYKYLVIQDGQKPIYENHMGRKWIIANEGNIKWQDSWSH